MIRLARALVLAPILSGFSPATAAPESDPPVSLLWKSRGGPRLSAALARAKAAKKRVLVALPGGDGCCGDVFIDRGPIGQSLEKEPFLSFAAACEAVLIEPPEAALCARAYHVERPGLLLLDGDGRWLAAATLAPTGGPTLAKEVHALLAGPHEPLQRGATGSWPDAIRITFVGGAPSDAAVVALSAISGVLEAKREGGAVVVEGVAEVVDPGAIAVALGAGGASPTPSHALKRWRLAGLEKSKAGLAMLRVPLEVRGVLSVRPDRPEKIVSLLVDSTFDAAALDAGWKAAYAEATPIP